MTDLSPSVVAEVKGFCERHQVDPASIEPTGLRFLFDDATTEEIAAALVGLRTRWNGTDPTK